MARDTRRRFENEARKLHPKVRDAFLQAIADVKRTADMVALITALERSDVAGALAALKLGPEYFAPLDEAIRSTYAAGGNYALDSLPKKNPATGTELVIRFQGRHPRAETWLTRQSSNLIVEITDGQRNAIRETIARRLADGVGPKKTALDLVGRVDKLTKRRTGGIVGLTSRDAGAVQNYRATLTAEGRKADQIDRMVSRYSNKLLRVRGERIARTETIAALNAGRDEGMQQLIDSGEVSADAVTGTWDSSGDGRVRDSHAEMDGQTQPQGQPFQSPTGALLMHPGDTSLGAGGEDTINCRCWKSIKVDYLTPKTGCKGYLEDETRADFNERFGMADKTPDPPEVPEEYQFLIEAFWNLNGTRIHNGMSLQPVQWIEFEAWQRGTGTVLTHDERKIVMELFPVLDGAVDEERPKPDVEGKS